MSENVKNQKSFHEPCGIAWPFECRPEPNECDPTKELCDGKRKDNVLDPPNWFMDSVNRYEKHGKEKKGYVLEPGANQSRFGGSMVLACDDCKKDMSDLVDRINDREQKEGPPATPGDADRRAAGVAVETVVEGTKIVIKHHGKEVIKNYNKIKRPR